MILVLERAIVAQRIMYDGVTNDGGLFKVQVDCKMMKYEKKAHSQYVCLLHRKIELQTDGEKRNFERRKFTNDIIKIKEAKQKCIEQLEQKTVAYNSQIFHLEK